MPKKNNQLQVNIPQSFLPLFPGPYFRSPTSRDNVFVFFFFSAKEASLDFGKEVGGGFHERWARRPFFPRLALFVGRFVTSGIYK